MAKFIPFCLFAFVFVQFFRLTFLKRELEFEFDCIRISAQPSGRNTGKIPLQPTFVEQKAGHKKLKGKIVAKKPIHGIVQSSGFPKLGYINQKCAVELEAPTRTGLVVHLTFADLDLEPRYSRSGQCLRDYLVLTIIDRDGREHTSERICGNEMPEPVRSMQSKARILFVASSSSLLGNSTRLRRRRGFKLGYAFVPEATILAPSSFYYDPDIRFRSQCGGVNSPTTLSGEIQSPGFPFTYPRNVTCYWLLRVASHRRLYIRILDLELSPTVAECDRASLHLLDGYRHDIQAMNMQKEEESWATAIISSTGGKRRGTATKIEKVTDADFCGSSQYFGEEGAKSYLSDGNRVLVKFTTKDGPSQEQLGKYKENRMPIGFRLLWTEVESLVATASDVPSPPNEEPDPDHPSIIRPEQCAGFLCLGGSFCVDSMDSICVERTRLCINETLRCDGVPNCAENDESDEAYCYSQNPVSLSAFALLLISLIFLLLLITFCILRRLAKPERVQKRQQRRERRKEKARIAREEDNWQRRRSSRLNSNLGEERANPQGNEGATHLERRKRRLSDTRMRKPLQIPSISSRVDQEQQRAVRTNLIPATPPILGEQPVDYGWKLATELNGTNEGHGTKNGDILLRDFDLSITKNEIHLKGNECPQIDEAIQRELPCLCPIQNGGGNAPKVRIVGRHLREQQWTIDGTMGNGEEENGIWERRRSAFLAMEEQQLANGKGCPLMMESIS